MSNPPSISAEFASLLTASQSRIYAYLVSLVGDTDLALDLLQEANQALITKAGEFAPGTNFIAWAFGMARIEVLRARDRHARRREIVFDERMIDTLGAEVEHHAEQAESELRALRHCLGELSVRSREAVTARYFRGVTVAAIASEMGLGANAVSQVLHRARMSLMDCVQSRLADEGGAA